MAEDKSLFKFSMVAIASVIGIVLMILVGLNSNNEIGELSNNAVGMVAQVVTSEATSTTSSMAISSSGTSIDSSTAETSLGCKWTDWKNRDLPSGTGDWETLADFTDVCTTPAAIDCKTSTGADYKTTGQVVSCTAKAGLICQNSLNSGGCKDYKVRFCCPTTTTYTPFLIGIGETAPSTDTVIAVDVSQQLVAKGLISPTTTGIAKLFGEINALQLDNQVTLAIYYNQAVIIVGATSPSSHTVFATAVSNILYAKGITAKVMLSSEVKSSNLIDLFKTTTTTTCIDTQPDNDMYKRGMVYYSDNSPIESGQISESSLENEDMGAKVLSSSSAIISIFGEQKTVQAGETVTFDVVKLYVKGIEFYGAGNSMNKVFYDFLWVKDFCDPDDSTAWMNVYCQSNTEVGSKEVTCPYECSGGACAVTSTNVTTYTYNDVCGDEIIGMYEACDGSGIGYNGGVSITLHKSSTGASQETLTVGGKEYVIKLLGLSGTTKSATLNVNGEYITVTAPYAKTASGAYIHILSLSTVGETGSVTLSVKGGQIDECSDLGSGYDDGDLSCTNTCQFDTSKCVSDAGMLMEVIDIKLSSSSDLGRVVLEAKNNGFDYTFESGEFNRGGDSLIALISGNYHIISLASTTSTPSIYFDGQGPYVEDNTFTLSDAPTQEGGMCVLNNTNVALCSYNGVVYAVESFGGCGTTATTVSINYMEGTTQFGTDTSIMQGSQIKLQNGIIVKNLGAPCSYPILNLQFVQDNSEKWCTDSDGGVYPLVKGSCIDSRGATVTDSCIVDDATGKTYVDEAFCLTPAMKEHCKLYNSADYCDNLPDECYLAPLLPTPGLGWSYFESNDKYFCKYGCKDGKCISYIWTSDVTLKDFPQPFLTQGGIPNAVFVVGRRAALDDVIGITDIIASLQRYAGNNPFPMGLVEFDDTLTEDDIYNRNVVIVGGMCANSVAERMYGSPTDCTEQDTPGVGKIRIMRNPNNSDKLVLLVHGYNAEDTTRATRVLANWNDYNHEFKDNSELCVTGSLTNMQVSKCR